MNNKVLAGIVIVALALLGVWYFNQQSVQAPEVSDESEVTDEMEDTNEGGGVTEITYTDSGFSPQLVTIEQGDTVRFVNASSRAFWPASAMHPTHTVYPGSDIELCGQVAVGVIFDSCGDVDPGDSWEFTFTQQGEWGYHDHLSSTHFGRVVVE